MKSTNSKFDASRRSVLKSGMTLATGIVTAGTLLRSSPARAAKAPKTTMMYQDKPHGDQKCSNCIHFVPGPKPSADGTCLVVEGSISPEGWCVVYAPKS